MKLQKNPYSLLKNKIILDIFVIFIVAETQTGPKRKRTNPMILELFCIGLRLGSAPSGAKVPAAPLAKAAGTQNGLLLNRLTGCNHADAVAIGNIEPVA